jgi:hypothetical protein
MEYPVNKNIPYEEIDNGALILLLLKECSTWEELCPAGTPTPTPRNSARTPTR